MKFWLKRRPSAAQALAAGLFICGAAFSLTLALWLHHRIENQVQAQYQLLTERTSAEIVRRLTQPVYGLNGARGVYAASERVTRSEFINYVFSRDLPEEFPGVRGFGFIERVDRHQIDGFLRRERQDDAADFAVRSLGIDVFDTLYVIKFIEPAVDNLGAQGLDVGSEARRRSAIEQAIDTGAPAITAPITLLQDNQGTPGILLYTPVYFNAQRLNSATERRAALRGVIYAPIVLNELLRGIDSIAEQGLNLKLTDPSAEAANSPLMFENHVPPGQRFHSVQTLSVPGRQLTLQMGSSARFDAAAVNPLPWLAGLAGMLTSALLALLLWQQAFARQRAEALARSMTLDLQRLALVAQKTSNAVIITDDSQRIIWVNDGFERISGYSAKEALGRFPSFLQSGQTDPDTIARMRETLQANQTFRGEILNRHKEGNDYWLALEIQPLHAEDGQLSGYMAIESDITARKEAEALAKRNADLLQGSIEALDDAFALFDDQDKLVLCNQRYRDVYPLCTDLMQPGCSFETIIRVGAERGQYAQAIGRVDDWVTERLALHQLPQSRLHQKLDDGRTLRILEHRMPNGYTVGFRVDITELVQATEAAQAASLSKSQFLANMSHEIRTPMNAVLGMLTLLQKTQLTRQQADYAGKGENAARSLLGLLNDILDLSKVESGKMVLDTHPFELSLLLTDLEVIVTAYIGQRPVRLMLEAAPTLPALLLGDALRLKQVLINLCGNAVKFTPEGQVTLSIHELDRTTDRVMLKFAVQDQGIGIAPENQARIFSGFTQAEASTTRRYGGTGLGLAISQKLIAMMGGHLELSSTLGQGSRFYFTLPLGLSPVPDAWPSSPPLSVPPAAGAKLQGWRILVVEDNFVNQQIADELLQGEGALVTLANHGQEALEVIASTTTPFDVVLMDMQMPVMDGLTATREIRLTKDARALPIVATTANAMDSEREACLQAGMNDHIGKPFQMDHLIHLLYRVTGKASRAT